MTNMQPVNPCKPAAPYVGGKRQLASTIIQRIENIPHKSYIEPFVGMGGVFFRRKHKPACEVINDRNGEVVNLFRVIQRHYAPFVELFSYTLSCRSEFERQKLAHPTTLTDLERAVRFLYLQKTAYGGKVMGQTYGVCADGRKNRFNPVATQQLLSSIRDRLSGVTIENLDYLECISRYDNPHTLFYFDPPYWGTEDTYGNELFNRDQYVIMAELLSDLKGDFLLSINDRPEIRKIFSEFHFQEVGLTYTVAARSKQKASELIISNV